MLPPESLPRPIGEAGGADYARCLDPVLDGEGDAVEPAERITTSDRVVCLGGFAESRLRDQLRDGVEFRVDDFDPPEMRFYDFAGG